RPLIALKPTRSPVNEPGPEAAAKPPRSLAAYPCLCNNAAKVGTSCAEKVPPAIGADSITRTAFSSACASVIPPGGAEVSIARMSIVSFYVQFNCGDFWQSWQFWQSPQAPSGTSCTSSSNTPPVLDGW